MPRRRRSSDTTQHNEVLNALPSRRANGAAAPRRKRARTDDRGAVRRADVCVVGAGLAGLRCAELLEEAGLRVAVLEARDRVGGRTLSKPVGRATLDLGGQWIGPGQHRLAALATRLGVATHPTFHEGRKVIAIGGKRSTYGG